MPPRLDPTQLEDWQIAEAAQQYLKPIEQVGDELGLVADELIPMGKHVGKVDHHAVLHRLGKKKPCKYIDVTAITPTPLGEGKTTTTLGLVQGLGKLGKRSVGAIRQASSGPTFNIKGAAAGGGLAQALPRTMLSLGLTGDVDRLTNAHNLGMVALTARLQHETNYDDRKLAQRNLERLDIDPSRVVWKWAMDFCAQALRQVRIGMGPGKLDGVEMDSGFQITSSSELMAILAVSRDLADLRRRVGRIVVAYDKQGQRITTEDLEVAGAMTAWLVDALNPNLVQTIEGQPMFVHAGPFANIAIGQSSVMADQLAVRLGEYVVTESGFGADIGFEKFWNLKCRYSKLKPDAVVIVATVRALKMHGGGPDVKPGNPLDPAYVEQNLPLLEAGCENLLAHIDIVRLAGVSPVVCLNGFHTDTPEEVALVRRLVQDKGARFAHSQHWLQGGEGAEELAQVVIEACDEPQDFQMLYEMDLPLKQRIESIATSVYGADGVAYSDLADEKLAQLEESPASHQLGTCMVKTHLSLSHDPSLKGRPTGWTLPIRDVLVYYGAGFLVPVAGDIKLMPGTGSDPAYRRMDIDTGTGQVRGLH